MNAILRTVQDMRFESREKGLYQCYPEKYYKLDPDAISHGYIPPPVTFMVPKGTEFEAQKVFDVQLDPLSYAYFPYHFWLIKYRCQIAPNPSADDQTRKSQPTQYLYNPEEFELVRDTSTITKVYGNLGQEVKPTVPTFWPYILAVGLIAGVFIVWLIRLNRS